jgi:hypothetical protein
VRASAASSEADERMDNARVCMKPPKDTAKLR